MTEETSALYMDTKIFYLVLVIKGALSTLAFTENEVEIISELKNHLNSKFLAFTQELDILTIKLLSRMKIFSCLTSLQRLFQELQNEDLARTLLVTKKTQGLNFYLEVTKNHSFPLFLLIFDYDFEVTSDYKKLAVPFGSRLFFVRHSGSKALIYEKLDLELGKQISFEKSSDLGNGMGVFIKRNHNFQRATLSLALVSETPCKKMEEQHVFQKIRCFHQQIFDLMAARLNFTKKIVECQDKANPYVFPNGSYSGLFKMLLDQEVVASSGSFVVSTKRLFDFDFVWPTFILKTMMYVKSERIDIDAYWSSYLEPFETQLWLTIVAYILISTAAVFYSRYFNRKYFNRKTRSTDAFDAFLSSFRIFCCQAWFDTSDSRFAIIFQLVTSFAVTILYTAYSGSIVSSLTVHHPVLPFHDLEGFFLSRKYKLTAIADSFVPYFFKEEYFPKKKISEEDFFLGFEKLPKNDREGIDGICDGISAYVGLRENVFNLKHYKCSVIEIPRPIFLQYLAIGVPQNSPFREDLNRELIYLRTSGILKRMESRLGDSGSTKTGQNEDLSIVFSVEIWEIISALVVLLAGCFIASVLLLAEIRFGKPLNHSLQRHTMKMMGTKQRILNTNYSSIRVTHLRVNPYNGKAEREALVIEVDDIAEQKRIMKETEKD